MSRVQRAAQIFGVIFILVTVIGFVQAGTSMEADVETAPRILGLFPVNLVHNLAHLVLGIWGLVAARSWGAAKSYGLIAGGLYLALAVLGLVSPSGMGLMPIGGHDIWLHALLGVGLLYFGATARAERTGVA